MKSRRALAVSSAVMLGLALAGCASAAGAAGPTVTTTVTATSTVSAEPTAVERSPEDPLTALDAWLVCWGATYGQYQESSTISSYTPQSPSGEQTVTDNGDGTFQVLVPFAPKTGGGSGAESVCVAGGTVGEPTVELQGGRDFG